MIPKIDKTPENRLAAVLLPTHFATPIRHKHQLWAVNPLLRDKNGAKSQGSTKEDIRKYISENFGYDLNRTCDEIRPTYGFDGSCQCTVPESIIAFLDSKDYEDALKLCISLGGDADTMGAITGAIAGAYYHRIPASAYDFGMGKLPADIKNVVTKFHAEHSRRVSYCWRNPEYDREGLIRKVETGEIVI